MRKVSKRDVDEAWSAWAASEVACGQCGTAPDNTLSPTAAARMIALLRFNSMFCDYVLQNESWRIVEVTQPAIMRATRERQLDLEEWQEDWEILPGSAAKEHYRRHLAQSHRTRMELICMRHLWLASQACGSSPDRRPLGNRTD